MFASFSQAAPSSFTYQGQIIKPTGSALEASSVTFTIEVVSPGPEACVLYSESHVINMTGSNGIFALEVGSGTRSGADFEDTNTLALALSNSTGLVTPTNCAAIGTYTPSSPDGRKLRVTFNDGTGPDVIGTTKLGAAGVAVTNMGACTVATQTYTANTPKEGTCMGMPTTSAVAVSCSPGAALSAAGAILARSTGVGDKVEITLTSTVTTVVLYCMWIQP